jgi:cytoskeletal protein RodZ
MIKEELKSLGNSFRQKRSERNISLKEAENATSIRMNYLQAIEEGDVSKIISPVYAQGFIKQYASFLGIDVEEIIRKNPDIFRGGKHQEFDYGIGTLEMRGSPGNNVKWVPNALWVGGFVLVILAAYYLATVLEVI